MLIAILHSLNASAVPLQLTQQGRMVDANGAPVDGLELVAFRIYDDANSGNMLWEDYLTLDFTNGYYAAVLGADTVNNPLDSGVLSLYPLYLELQLGTNTPMNPRTVVNSTPFSQIAGVAESVDGGTVNASTVSINGTPVIDNGGSWVGQPLTVDWSNVANIPGDIADGDANTQLSEIQVEGYINNDPIDLHPSTTMNLSGLLTQADVLTPDWNNVTNRPLGLDDGDDDTLSGLGCGQGEIVGWDGVNWICTSDATLTESDVENYVTNDLIDLAAGSTMAGLDLMTSDDDTLSDLNCLDGEIPRWDGVSGVWYCAEDTMGSLNCSDGEVTSYDASTGAWVCTNVQTLFDSDGDGVAAWADCDDGDASIGSSVLDNDCDGLMTSDDCDDFDVNANAVADDNDCDGALTADDCNDNDANSTIIATDADCDGYVTIQDCNDNDPNSTIVATDADCDGVLTSQDCDDSDPNITSEGGSISCPGQSCNAILADNPNSPDGSYYIDPNGMGVREVYCDMTLDDGGWTLVYINNNPSKLSTNTSGEQGSVGNLATLSGDSAKFSDSYINAIREYSDNRIGYRVSSNDITNRYFSPSDCTYTHFQHNNTECRQYVANYTTSTNPGYTQCDNWGGDSGGLDNWYRCNGSGYTNVMNTHRSSSYPQTGGITTNTGGTNLGDSNSNWPNDILMWVR